MVDSVVGSLGNLSIPRDKNAINAFFPIFGQFLDHDMTLTMPGTD